MEATVQLDPSPASIAVARRWAAERAVEWGAADIVDRLKLVVSELVTNAVVHAGTDFQLRLRTVGPSLTVEVVDGSPQLPVVREAPKDDDLGGRGMHIVEAFAAAWGCHDTPPGKTVWAEMDLSAR